MTFQEAFFTSLVWQKITWLGVPILKNPMDLFIYQEILHEVKPDTIIECGTAAGGSALYLASICDLMGHGKVITIDINGYAEARKHPRITYLVGSSVSPDILDQAKGIAEGKILVILDSDHTKDHVSKEIALYSPLVSSGSYLIVEDTCINFDPMYNDHGPGPREAVEEFMKTSKDFVVDKEREKLLSTFNPGGYLRKMPECC